MSKKTDFEEMVDVEDTQADEVEIVDLEKKPTEYDPDWSEYLLDELSDHELINGAPTVDGLRRITEKCFGEIIVIFGLLWGPVKIGGVPKTPRKIQYGHFLVRGPPFLRPKELSGRGSEKV